VVLEVDVCPGVEGEVHHKSTVDLRLHPQRGGARIDNEHATPDGACPGRMCSAELCSIVTDRLLDCSRENKILAWEAVRKRS
jgi:hypothetical protein